jgi:hypothetical protein
MMNQKQRSAGERQEHPLPRVRSFYAYFLRGAALVLVLTVVGLPVNFALGGSSDSAVSVLLEVGDVFSILCLVIAALARRGEKKAIRRILTEKRTVHWTYAPAEWQRFTRQAWRRSLRSTAVLTGIMWVILLIVFMASFTNVLSGVALGTAVAVLLGLLLSLLAAVLLQGRRHHTGSDVYISRAGIILNGWYYGLGGWTGGLRRVSYKASDPGALSFDIGWGRSRRVFEVPVPHDREAEAQQMSYRLLYS